MPACLRSSAAERLTCNQQVGGSNPPGGFRKFFMLLGNTGFMEIKEFQRQIKEIYYENDIKRGAEATFLWFAEEVGELAEAMRKKDKAAIGEEIADVLAWLISLANILDIDVEEEVRKKYPDFCPKCGKKPCNCGY